MYISIEIYSSLSSVFVQCIRIHSPLSYHSSMNTSIEKKERFNYSQCSDVVEREVKNKDFLPEVVW